MSGNPAAAARVLARVVPAEKAAPVVSETDLISTAATAAVHRVAHAPMVRPVDPVRMTVAPAPAVPEVPARRVPAVPGPTARPVAHVRMIVAPAPEDHPAMTAAGDQTAAKADALISATIVTVAPAGSTIVRTSNRSPAGAPACSLNPAPSKPLPVR